MILRVMSLFANLECNVEVVPYEHKGLALCDLPCPSQSLFAETLEFADGLRIYDRVMPAWSGTSIRETGSETFRMQGNTFPSRFETR